MKVLTTAHGRIRWILLAVLCIGTLVVAPWGLPWGQGALAQDEGAWQVLPDMPLGKWEPGTVVLDNKLFVFGGYTLGVVSSKRSEVFDPGDNSWTRIQDLPSAITDRKSTRLNSSHKPISYAVFCMKKKHV